MKLGMSTEHERRRYPRHEADLLAVVMDELGENETLCRLENFSQGGLAVEVPEKDDLRIETSVLVEIPLGRSASRIRTRCRVIAVVKNVARLEFLDDSEIFQRVIAACIESWKLRAHHLQR